MSVAALAGGVGLPPAEQLPAGRPEEIDVDPAASALARPRAAEDPRALRRSVLLEFVIAVVVLVLSAVLVGAAPGRPAAATSQPLDVTLPLQGTAGPRGSVEVGVDPARPGPNVLHVYVLDADGQPVQPVQLSVSLSEPERHIGPLDVTLTPDGPGHYLADAMPVPSAGTWTLAVDVRLDAFTALTASTPFPVR